MTNSKFTKEQREKAMFIMADSDDLDIMPLEIFMTSYKPYEIARRVRLAGLNLDRNYIRVNVYYADTFEADEPTDLISDAEVAWALQDLQ